MTNTQFPGIRASVLGTQPIGDANQAKPWPMPADERLRIDEQEKRLPSAPETTRQ